MSDSGHPRNFGYVQCLWCKAWRPLMALSKHGTCAVWSMCGGGIPRGPALSVGWDANGAPTSVGANGDAE